MKKLVIIAFLGTALMFQNCAPKEKQEVTATPNDTIVVTPTEAVIVESDVDEVVVEDQTTTVTVPADKSTTVVKVTAKEPGKVVTQTKTETKVGAATKTEVVTKTVAADEPKKTVVAETPAKVVVKETPVKVAVQEPKATTSASNWVVPAKYQSMKNPTDPKVDLAIGKSLFTKHCKSCHGTEGYGDGVKAKEMKGDLGDFSTGKFQSQSDGALFYKTTMGRDDMPAFNKKLPSDEDRWLVVNYMRTLKK